MKSSHILGGFFFSHELHEFSQIKKKAIATDYTDFLISLWKFNNLCLERFGI